jgi:hypothetical protein
MEYWHKAVDPEIGVFLFTRRRGRPKRRAIAKVVRRGPYGIHFSVTDSVLKGEMRPLRNPLVAHEMEDLIDDET